MCILLIEDETKLRKQLKQQLTYEGYEVDVAEDGEVGSRTNAYDAIILDNNLPKKTGVEVLKDIRKSGKNTPVIVLSVLREGATKVELLDAGADDYVTKPYDLQELLARIRARIRPPHQHNATILMVDDLVVDTKKHRVTRPGKDIELRKKEFELLKYLMRNRGDVVTRGMILEYVWHMDVDPFSTTVDAHLSSLRRKIDLSDAKPLIHTVQGYGYKLDEKP